LNENGNKKSGLTVSLLREPVPFVSSDIQEVLVGPDSRSLTYLGPLPAANTDPDTGYPVTAASKGLNPGNHVTPNMDFEHIWADFMEEDQRQ